MTPTFRVLVVSAHPDDIEFGCAGAVATWADQGAEVTFCVVTDGSTGTQDKAVIGKGLTATRRDETERAAAVLGAREVVWLGYPDGSVEYTLDLRRDIARVFRAVRPHRFLVMDVAPTIGDWFINHPDHQAVGRASLDVVPAAGTTPGHFPELLDEGLMPWRGLREVWIVGPAGGPVAVDISAAVDRKAEALLCHVSQVGENAQRIGEWIKQRAAEAGAEHGFDFAETFRVISEGPGFHEDEQDEPGVDMARAPLDPRSARRAG